MTESNTPLNKPKRPIKAFVLVVLFTAIFTALIFSLLVDIFQKKQEAKNTYLKFVNVDENTSDPQPWGMNWERQYDQYLRTVDKTRTEFGGSESLPPQKSDKHP